MEAVVVLALALWAVWAVRAMIKRKKQGKSLTCGGNCACCGTRCGQKKQD